MPRIAHLIAPALAASLALGIAAPASAQGRDGWRQDTRQAERIDHRSDRFDRAQSRALQADIKELARDIRQAERRRLLYNPSELRGQLARLQHRFDAFSRQGINPREAQLIRNNTVSLRRSLNMQLARAERFGGRYSHGYGRR